MTRSTFVVALALVHASVATADQTGDRLAAAAAAAQAERWDTVEHLAQAVLDDGSTARGDRGEAHRLLGLAALTRQDPGGAEAHFLAYLKLDLDGRLDPARYPPETVAFFEDVRGRHAAELRALRPRPRRWRALNLLPPAGQFQNGDRGKGLVLAVVGGTALATNLGTYALLRSWCADDGTCTHTRAARAVRVLNLGAGIAAIGLYAFGVWDGFRHFKQTPTVTLTPIGGPGISGVGVMTTF